MDSGEPENNSNSLSSSPEEGTVLGCAYCDSQDHQYNRAGDCPIENQILRRRKLSESCCHYCKRKDHSFSFDGECPVYNEHKKMIASGKAANGECGFCSGTHKIQDCRERKKVLRQLYGKSERPKRSASHEVSRGRKVQKSKRASQTSSSEITAAFRDLQSQAAGMRDAKKEIEDKQDVVAKKKQEVKDRFQILDDNLEVTCEHERDQQMLGRAALRGKNYMAIKMLDDPQLLMPTHLLQYSAVLGCAVLMAFVIKAAVGLGSGLVDSLRRRASALRRVHVYETQFLSHVTSDPFEIISDPNAVRRTFDDIVLFPPDNKRKAENLAKHVVDALKEKNGSFVNVARVLLARPLSANISEIMKFFFSAGVVETAVGLYLLSNVFVRFIGTSFTQTVLDALTSMRLGCRKRHVARKFEYFIHPEDELGLIAPPIDVRPDLSSLSDIKHPDPAIMSATVRESSIDRRSRGWRSWLGHKAANLRRWWNDMPPDYDCICVRYHIPCECDDTYYTFERVEGESRFDFSFEILSQLLGGKKQDPRNSYDAMVADFTATCGRTHTVNYCRYYNIDGRLTVNTVYLAVAIAQHNRREMCHVGGYPHNSDPPD